MTGDKRLDYLDAKQDFDVSMDRFNTIRNMISSTSENFKDASSVLQQSFVSIPDISIGWKKIVITKDTWPTFEEIRECILAVQQSYKRAEQLYQLLSSEEKRNLVSPDSTLIKYNLKV
jgi:hypothetical protein